MKIKTLLDYYLHELSQSGLPTGLEKTTPDIHSNLANVYSPTGSGGFSGINPNDHVQVEDFNILNQDLADGSFDTNMSSQMDSPSNNIRVESEEEAFNNDATNSPSSQDLTFQSSPASIKESKHSSRSLISAQTKIKRAQSQLSSIEARKHNDSDYKQMIYHREKYQYYLDKVHRKYGSRVRSRARQ